MRITVLLTAAVKPQVDSGLIRSSVDVRLADYKAALTFWERVPRVTDVLWLDNTGVDPAALGSYGGRVTLHSFTGDCRTVRARGKGWGEGELLRYAGKLDQVLRSDLVLKVTGRLYVRNASRLLSALEAIDERRTVFADMFCWHARADSRAFVCPPDFLLTVLPRFYDHINETAGIEFEHVLARAIHHWQAMGEKWSPMPVSPQYVGVAGTSGIPYRPFSARSARRNLLSWMARASAKRRA